MLKLLVDECVPYRVVERLRQEGFDVLSATESMKGEEDRNVMKAASRENRLLITNDKDFGEMIYRDRIKRKGVILLRLSDGSFENALKHLLRLFDRFGKSLKHKDIVVVSEKSIRIRSY